MLPFLAYFSTSFPEFAIFDPVSASFVADMETVEPRMRVALLFWYWVFLRGNRREDCSSLCFLLRAEIEKIRATTIYERFFERKVKAAINNKKNLVSSNYHSDCSGEFSIRYIEMFISTSADRLGNKRKGRPHESTPPQDQNFTGRSQWTIFCIGGCFVANLRSRFCALDFHFVISYFLFSRQIEESRLK